MHCIDIGCGGGGEVALEIARLVAPGGSVVGVDIDEVKALASARIRRWRRPPRPDCRSGPTSWLRERGPAWRGGTRMRVVARLSSGRSRPSRPSPNVAAHLAPAGHSVLPTAAPPPPP